MLDPVAVAALAGKYPPLVFQQEYKAEFVDWNGSAFFGELSMLVDGAPVEAPQRCDQVFAVIDTALKDGFEHDGTAVTYYARNKISGHPLVILDWEILQIEGALLDSWLPSVNMRLEQLSAETGARQGNAGIYIEDKASGIVLIQQGVRRGLPVYPVPAALTALGKEGRALSVSAYVFQGMVKICRYAYEKTINYKGQTRNHLISQVCGFRMGQKDGPRDLLDTFCYGIAISLGDADGW
jgi:phage terminase large subunit-like protein